MCPMRAQRGFKTELDLNNKQRTACLRHAGAARFAYNFGLRRKAEAYQAGEKVPSAIDLHRASTPPASAVRRAIISETRCAYLNGRTSAKRAAGSRIATSTPHAILHNWLPRVPREGTPVERV